MPIEPTDSGTGLGRVATSAYNTPYGINPNSNTYANDVFAAVTREQWANYVNTFVPIENKLIKYATDPTVVSDAMADASTGVHQAFAAQEGSTNRRLQGMGVSLSPEEQAAQTRSSGLREGLADVQAQNTARDLTTQRQQGILGSPVPQGV
jgi:hypothetical protein